MRSRIPQALGLALLLVAAAACSSTDAPQPQPPVRSYGPEAAGVGSPDLAYPRPSGPVASGSIRWHQRLADAQAEARATGKMLLVLATKPRCGLCDKFKNDIAPAVGGEVNRIAVGYIYDITRPEVRQVDRTLRANLRGADLMPLVGFVTPELGWVHGFWGQRSVSQFRGDISRAASIHPVRGARVVPPTRRQGPTTAMVLNEYGEREWAARADVWPDEDPEPIDAITGAPDSTSGAAAASVRAPAAVLADLPAAGASAPVALQPAGSGGALPPLVPAGPPLAAAAAPAAAPAAAAPAPAPAPESDESWARRTLQRARTLIADGRFDEARGVLSQVRARVPETPLAREAGKGGVALYNAKRIRLATSGSERDRYLTRARRDFGNSMWGPLFDS